MPFRPLPATLAGLAILSLSVADAAPRRPSSAAKPAGPAAAASATPGPSDWRTPDPQDVLVIDTNKGRIFVELAPQVAPQAVERVRTLARQHFYDGLTFFRVIEDFMDQTGDPKNVGSGGSTLPDLPPEFSFRRGSDAPFTSVAHLDGQESGLMGSLPVISQPIALAAMTADARVNAYGTFCAGVTGIARAQTPNSGNSQFFLMRGTETKLDQGYTPFGRVIAGQDVVRAIKVGEPPVAPADRMETVRVLSDLPPASRPHVRVIDTASAWFAAYVAKVRADKGDGFTVCDLELPSDIK
ncbi:MAG: peptidylprolyl isomerase [Caulobacteraceae bacterium]|nr:peptidylprolyl isomerase [Caulobacteraceae bacterium]